MNRLGSLSLSIAAAGRLRAAIAGLPLWLREMFPVLLAPLLLLGPALLRGEVLFWGTPALQFVPWWREALRQLGQGVLPLWNPLNGLGAPLLANYQSAFLYPPNWLLLVFGALAGPENASSGIALGYTLLAAAHLAWAGTGMSVLLKRMGFAGLPRTIGGLAFGLSGYIIGRLGFFSMVWVAAWLPWVIYLTDRLVPRAAEAGEGNGAQHAFLPLALTGTIAMQLLAGHAQLTAYSLVLAGAWLFWAAIRERAGWRMVLFAAVRLATAVFAAAAIAAPQLVMTFEFLRLSQRADAVGYEEALTYSFWPWRLVTIAAPDFFGSPAGGDYWGYASYWEDHLYAGMVPFLLALSTLPLLVRGAFRCAARTARWALAAGLWAGLVVTLVIAMGRFTPIFPFLYEYVPGVDMFQAPARYLIWAAFALPLLAALGAERWCCPTGRGLYWFRLATAGAFAVTLGAGAGWLLMHGVSVTFIRSLALAGMWALGFGLLTLLIPYAERRGLRGAWQAAVVCWLLADLLFNSWGLNPTAGLDFYAGKVREPLPVGARTYLSARGEHQLKFNRFLRFDDFTRLEDWRNMRLAGLPNLNLLDGAAQANNFDPLVTAGYARWRDTMEGLNPQNRASWLAWAGVGAVEEIDVRRPGGVRFDALTTDGVGEPTRAHWYGAARSAPPGTSFCLLDEEIAAGPVRADRAAIVEAGAEEIARAGGEGVSGGGTGMVNIVADRPDRVVLSAQANRAGWVVLMDSWYPGWQVTVNGKPAPLYRADGIFRAAAVPAGKSEIVFFYRPPGFIFGSMFSILVLLSIACWRVVLARRKQTARFAAVRP